MGGDSVDGIHLTYEDGTLLTDRLANIWENDFWAFTHNVWCDETQQEYSPLSGWNIVDIVDNQNNS